LFGRLTKNALWPKNQAQLHSRSPIILKVVELLSAMHLFSLFLHTCLLPALLAICAACEFSAICRASGEFEAGTSPEQSGERSWSFLLGGCFL